MWGQWGRERGWAHLGTLPRLTGKGATEGMFPGTNQEYLDCGPRNVARAEYFIRGMKIKVVTGSRYLEVFVGNRAAEDIWLADKV